MGIGTEILRGVGSVALKAGTVLVKEGYRFGKATGKGVVKGTAILTKEVVKKSIGK